MAEERRGFKRGEGEEGFDPPERDLASPDLISRVQSRPPRQSRKSPGETAMSTNEMHYEGRHPQKNVSLGTLQIGLATRAGKSKSLICCKRLKGGKRQKR